MKSLITHYIVERVSAESWEKSHENRDYLQSLLRQEEAQERRHILWHCDTREKDGRQDWLFFMWLSSANCPYFSLYPPADSPLLWLILPLWSASAVFSPIAVTCARWSFFGRWCCDPIDLAFVYYLTVHACSTWHATTRCVILMNVCLMTSLLLPKSSHWSYQSVWPCKNLLTIILKTTLLGTSFWENSPRIFFPHRSWSNSQRRGAAQVSFPYT